MIDAEGWLHTGDLALMRPDGCFRITGRAKDMISRGGEKIYPREIEEFLHRHPKVADVYVVGLPDERLGESVLAWIKLKNGQRPRRKSSANSAATRSPISRSRSTSASWTSFPMTANGKVQKYLIREQEIRERGLETVAGIATA